MFRLFNIMFNINMMHNIDNMCMQYRLKVFAHMHISVVLYSAHQTSLVECPSQLMKLLLKAEYFELAKGN